MKKDEQSEEKCENVKKSFHNFFHFYGSSKSNLIDIIEFFVAFLYEWEGTLII
jgi:hypothetical protein